MRSSRCLLILLFSILLLSGCAHVERRTLETTAYCGCGQCCSWERGSWKFLKLDFWNTGIMTRDLTRANHTGDTLPAAGSRVSPIRALFQPTASCIPG